MMFSKLRKNMKGIIIVVAAAFAVTLLYAGGVNFVGGGNPDVRTVVARANGSEISLFEVNREYRLLDLQRRLMGAPLQGWEAELTYYQVFRDMVDQKLLIEQARQSGLRVDRGDLNARIQAERQNFQSNAEFRAALNQQGFTEREFRDWLEERLLIQQVVELQGRAEVSDEEVARAFEAVEARHILVRPENPGEEASWAQAEAKALSLLEQIRQGADFAALAQEHSDDQASAVAGGDLGYFRRGTMVPRFEEAAFSLEVGEVSEPVRTDFGYHLIEVVDRREAEGEAFEAARESIREQLAMEGAQARLIPWIEELRDQAEIEILDPRLRAMHLFYQEDWEAAVSAFETAFLDDPFNAYLHVFASQAYEALDQPEAAADQLRLAVQKSPYDPDLRLLLALELQESHPQEAAEHLREASELSPSNMNLQNFIVGLARELDDEELAGEAAARAEEARRILEERQRQIEELQRQQEELLRQLQEAREAAEAEAAPETNSDGSEPAAPEEDGSDAGEGDQR